MLPAGLILPTTNGLPPQLMAPVSSHLAFPSDSSTLCLLKTYKGRLHEQRRIHRCMACQLRRGQSFV